MKTGPAKDYLELRVFSRFGSVFYLQSWKTSYTFLNIILVSKKVRAMDYTIAQIHHAIWKRTRAYVIEKRPGAISFAIVSDRCAQLTQSRHTDKPVNVKTDLYSHCICPK